MSWVQVHSGRPFDLINFSIWDIRIEDIAQSLSRICRFNGHVIVSHYSVAEHCCHISDLCPDLETMRWGLLHDAPEAYIGDASRPLRSLISGYKEIEYLIMQSICIKYGLQTYEMPVIVEELDDRILVNERDQVMAPPFQDWEIGDNGIPGLSVEGWPQKRAYTEFMSRFRYLYDEGTE